MTRLPAGRSSTSIPGSSPSSSSRLGQAQPALAAGEERRGDLGEVAARPRRRSPRSGARPSRVRSPRSCSSSSRLRSRSARCVGELVEALLLGLVLLLRERVDLAELLAAALEPLELLGELVAVLALGRLGAAASSRRCASSRSASVRASSTSIAASRSPAGGGALAQLDLLARRAGAAPRRARSCAPRVGLDPLAERRLEAVDVDARARPRAAPRSRAQPLEHELARPARAARVGTPRAPARRPRARSAASSAAVAASAARDESSSACDAQLVRPSPVASAVRPLARRSAASARAVRVGELRAAARPRAPRSCAARPARRPARSASGASSRAARRGRDAQASRRAVRRRRRAARAAPGRRAARCAGARRARTPRRPSGHARRPASATACGLVRAAGQLLHLGVQLAAARVELEQDGLGRLAGEPELAALRVPADAVAR